MPLRTALPRRNPLLPFVKFDKNGRLTYERRIPAELRAFLGGKASIRRTLATESTDVGSTGVLAAYAAVHSEVEALIAGARQGISATSGLTTQQPTGIRAELEQFPLSRRDIAGIAGQVLLDIREAVEKQGQVPTESADAVGILVMKVKAAGISGVSVADFALLATPTLNSLGITPSPGDMRQIGEALLRYVPVMQADIEKLQAFDFSQPKLKEIAPPLPTRQVTWADLVDAWLTSAGGVLEVDGYGVSQDRQLPYEKAVREFREVITAKPPNELTIEDARRYTRWLQKESGKANRTQQARLNCLKNLLRIGIEGGLVQSNPFNDVRITTPAGAADQLGYKAFNKEELTKIFELISKDRLMYQRMAMYILICTGCRLSEAIQLRKSDIKQTDKGVWYIDWKHEPTASPPMLLKTKTLNNRQCPIHKRLIDAGFLDEWKACDKQLFPDAPTTPSYSIWFRDRLVKLDLWVFKKTVIHSLRGSARDLWREAGIPQEFRNAFTGHASKDVGETKYGTGLKMMPDITAKELKKIDLNWLP